MKKKKLLWLFFITSFIAFFSFFITKNFQTDDKIPVLQPHFTEFKKKPEYRGGIMIPNADSAIYQNSYYINHKKIKFLPTPEEPIYLKQPSTQTVIIDSIDHILDNLDYYENYYRDIEISDQKNKQEEQEVLPNKITFSSKERKNEEELSCHQEEELAITKSSKNRFSNLDYEEKQKASYKVQISVTSNKQDAKLIGQKIFKANQKILQNSEIIIEKLEAPNNKIFYLVMAGPFEKEEKARRICQKLTAKNQHCIVVK
jgi:hypothetical protein